MNIITYTQGSLPQIPVDFSLDGENLDKSALILRDEFMSVEQAVREFRATKSPERLPYFRRYYLKPHKRGGAFAGQYSIRYVWNLGNPATDRTIGVFKGDDLPAAQILIGNNVSGAFMTPIRWELSEDRDGEEPIAIGRFDAWSLLQDVTSVDLERLQKRDLIPNLAEWDFDEMFINRICPECGKRVKINTLAYNIDSAKCCHCGIRPFLSRSLSKSLHTALPSVTGGDMQSSKDVLWHTISWMGGVNASVQDLHREELPEGTTPHQVLKRLLSNSHLVIAGGEGNIQLHHLVLDKIASMPDGDNVIAAIHSAASVVAQAIESGAPFTPLHVAMINMLKAV